MMQSDLVAQPQAVLAFDRLAPNYDDIFTQSVIGRAQRNAVWDACAKAFNPGDHILELNCGTGEDAIFLSNRGISVLACDASEGMVEVARHRVHLASLGDRVQVKLLPTEHLNSLSKLPPFDGVLSNFSGLNCVADLAAIVRQLAPLVKPGAPILICLCTRFCLFEIVWFLLHGQFRKAFRRCSGSAVARLEGFHIQMQYPTVRRLRRTFSPSFKLHSCRGIGILVPPSYVESWAQRHPRTLRVLESIDRRICDLPGFRVVGDHLLLRFERVDL
jgi:ubiquinone/menaquinone biosynthesis C-methylase UbiE